MTMSCFHCTIPHVWYGWKREKIGEERKYKKIGIKGEKATIL